MQSQKASRSPVLCTERRTNILCYTGIYDLTLHLSSEADAEYVEAVRDKMQTTSDVVQAFVNLSTQSSAGLSNDVMRKQRQESETEVRALLFDGFCQIGWGHSTCRPVGIWSRHGFSQAYRIAVHPARSLSTYLHPTFVTTSVRRAVTYLIIPAALCPPIRTVSFTNSPS